MKYIQIYSEELNILVEQMAMSFLATLTLVQIQQARGQLRFISSSLDNNGGDLY
jgi:hypothetical protein